MPSAAPAARVTWRSACTTRPRLPMRRPMSPLSAWTSSETSPRRSIRSTSTASGSSAIERVTCSTTRLGAATDDAVALARRLRLSYSSSRSSSTLVGVDSSLTPSASSVGGGFLGAECLGGGGVLGLRERGCGCGGAGVGLGRCFGGGRDLGGRLHLRGLRPAPRRGPWPALRGDACRGDATRLDSYGSQMPAVHEQAVHLLARLGTLVRASR